MQTVVCYRERDRGPEPLRNRQPDPIRGGEEKEAHADAGVRDRWTDGAPGRARLRRSLAGARVLFRKATAGETEGGNGARARCVSGEQRREKNGGDVEAEEQRFTALPLLAAPPPLAASSERVNQLAGQ